MASNLPPGVTDSMIPGNRIEFDPEDFAFEQAMEWALDELAITLDELAISGLSSGHIRKVVLVGIETVREQLKVELTIDTAMRTIAELVSLFNIREDIQGRVTIMVVAERHYVDGILDERQANLVLSAKDYLNAYIQKQRGEKDSQQYQ